MTEQSSPSTGAAASMAIPPKAGIGLRADHYREVMQTQPDVGWLEIHPENFFADGGRHIAYLDAIRPQYPLSMHGVGLSLGSADGLDSVHLGKLKRLIDRYQPALVSEHICWGTIDGRHTNDLLPLPYTEEALAHLVERVQQAQEFLQRQILLENVSSYLEYEVSDIPEWEFVAELSSRAGCGVLLDINNIYVNAQNHGFDPLEFIEAISPESVQEMHLAGFSINDVGGRQILIDTHNQPVCDAVWALYRQAIAKFGPTATLIEWDMDLPPLAALVDQARLADAIIEEYAIAA